MRHRWTTAICFKLSARKAAECAGFPRKDANQLAAAIGELASNIVDHSFATNTGILGFAWCPGRFEFTVSDQGIGVLESLKSSEEFSNLSNHGEALKIATAEGKSRFGANTGRGMGFRQIFIGLMSHKGDLRFRSGDHALELRGAPRAGQSRARAKAPRPSACHPPRRYRRRVRPLSPARGLRGRSAGRDARRARSGAQYVLILRVNA